MENPLESAVTLIPKEERTRHLIVEHPALLTMVVRKELGLDAAGIETLLYWGAIYLNKDRITEDRNLIPGDYVRVHLQPRRFPAAALDWATRVFADTEDFVLVNKPPEVPVPPTLDNIHENVLACMSRALGTRLWITHRLDLPTQGLLVLARSTRFQSLFNKWLNEGRVEKEYRALVASPLEPATLVHWQQPSKAAPKLVSLDPQEGWQRCELRVISSEPHAEGHEVRIRLITGRTHQIRCQLAAVGAPLLGDTLYGGPERAAGVALQACSLRLPDRHNHSTLAFELPAPW